MTIPAVQLRKWYLATFPERDIQHVAIVQENRVESEDVSKERDTKDTLLLLRLTRPSSPPKKRRRSSFLLALLTPAPSPRLKNLDRRRRRRRRHHTIPTHTRRRRRRRRRRRSMPTHHTRMHRRRRHINHMPMLNPLNLILRALLLANREVVRQEVCAFRRRGRVHHVLWGFRWWWRGLWHGPHVHCDGPVGLNHCLPDLGQDDFAIGPDEVVVAFVDVGADYVDVEEGLFDQFFHALGCVSKVL